MQALYQDETERNNSRETDLVGTVIYIEGIYRYLEEEYYKRLRRRKFELYNSWEVFFYSTICFMGCSGRPQQLQCNYLDSKKQKGNKTKRQRKEIQNTIY